MRILLTEGQSRLARAFLARTAAADDVFIRVLSDARLEDTAPGIEVLQGDLRDAEVVRAALRDVDAVVHLLPLHLSHTASDHDPECLDVVMRGGRILMLAALEAGVRRLILGSSLRLFDRLPAHWKVDELWRPRPEPSLRHLLPWMAELATRELVRRGSMEAICLRFGEIVDGSLDPSLPYDPRWVHVDDAVHGLERALAFDHGQMLDAGLPDWSVFHVMSADPRSKIRHGHETGIEERATSASQPFGYAPQIRFDQHAASATPPATGGGTWQRALTPPAPIASRPIRRVVIFGAGGPMGASTARSMRDSYTLRLTDLRPISEIRSELRARNEYDRIVPPALDAPHESRVVDVRDPDQVMAACEGMDAIINTSVLRMDPVDAFRVSSIGAYNIARAAAAHGIRRIVQTGPLLHLVHGHGSHLWDYQIPVEAPSRPYESLYFLSKYLGQEIMRVFAEHHDLEVAVMLFWELVNPAVIRHQPPFFVSWPDAGRALHRALEVPALPTAYEEFNVSVDLPHGKFDHSKIRRVLGWEPLDVLDRFWQYED